MRSSRGVFSILAVVGSILIYRNRFAIQRQLEALGIRTPLMKRNLAEAVRSGVSKVAGRIDRANEHEAAEDKVSSF